MGQSKNRWLQEAFAAHLRHLGRVDPQDKHEQVVLIIDNAPWQDGQVVSRALADNPHLEFKRLPSSSPRLNALERFWRVLLRRCAHHRLFETRADLKRSLRANLSYFQTMRGCVRSLIDGCYTMTVK